MSEPKVRSYLMMISAMLIYGTIGIFRRFIPLPSALLACLRGFMGAGVLLLFLKLTGKTLRHGIGKKALIGLVITGGVIGLNWMLLFEAYNYTSVATATLCYYMQPTILILLSPIVFREKLTQKKLLCALLALVGMVLVSGILENSAAKTNDLKGVFFGLAAAALYATVIILNKKLPSVDAYEKTVIQLLGAAVVLLPYLCVTKELGAVSMPAKGWGMLLIVGIVHTGFAYALYFGAMEALSAQSIAVCGYIDPVSALLLSAVFLGEKLTVYGILGAVLIIGSALVSELDLPLFRREE